MLGHAMEITTKSGQTVVLRAPTMAEVGKLAELFTGNVTKYTMMLGAQSELGEQEWLADIKKSKTDYLWGVFVDGRLAGVTGLHDIDIFNTCKTGIILGEEFQGKGVASAAHLARTLWAVKRLNRYVIHSGVLSPNEFSRKALERVGYTVTGITPCYRVVDGEYLDLYRLTWLHPDRLSILMPSGVPNMYRDGVERARLALSKAEREVKFL